MVSPRREVSRRRSALATVGPTAAGGAPSSAELLAQLADRDPVGPLLHGHGVTAANVRAGAAQLSEARGPEPADWRLRLSARGGNEGDLAMLLAICRSADSHAYQLLEMLGVCGATLRREVIERMRSDSGARLRATVATSGRPSSTPVGRPTPPRPRRTPGPGRTHGVIAIDTGRRSASEAEPAPRRPPETEAAPRPVAPAPERIAESEPDPVPGPRTPLQRIDPQSLPRLEGREPELQRIADALGRRRIRVPLLVGPPGSGRSLLVQHLSRVLPDPFFRLDATAYDDEEGLADDLRAIDAAGGIAILDDLDRVPSEAAPPFIGALSHAWSTGTPRVLTVVSPEGHGRLSTWLPGAMQSVDVLSIEPLRGSALEAAVKAAAPGVLAEHGVSLAADAKVGELTRWAERFLTGLAMPARALDLLDLSCARAVRRGQSQVGRNTWLEIVSERSGLSAARIEARADQEILDLEARLARRVVGHEEAVSSIARLIRRNRAGFGGARPVLSALLLGPSGIGKTELAKALSAALYDDDSALIRLDMSEFAESHAVARIVGAPPGYVGHEHGGALSDPLLSRPHCVVLLDEIEKAHRDVHQLLLQVFDEGRLTDGRGRIVDFRHAALIMTSNLGSEYIRTEAPGVATMDESKVLEAARGAFPVELWNRIEAPLVLHPLSHASMAKVCRRLAATSSERLFKERGIRYSLSSSACDHLVGLAGRDPSLGARPLRHLLTREVESLVADAILRGQLRAGTQVEVSVRGGRLVLR